MFLGLAVFMATGCDKTPKTDSPAREAQRAMVEPACKCFREQTCAKGFCQGIGSVSVDELKTALPNKDFLLINVRVPVVGSIPGTDAVIPNENLDQLSEYIGKDPRRKVVLYCRTVPRARSAAQALAERGFRNVSVLEGGILAWQASEGAGQASP